MKKICSMFFLVCFMVLSGNGYAEELEVKGIDTPDDAGNSVVLIWPAHTKETPRMSYELEAWSDYDKSWHYLVSFSADNMWQTQYPEVFGFLEGKKVLHAIKLTMAPPPVDEIEKQKEKSVQTLVATKEKLADIAEDIESVRVEYERYVFERDKLESQLADLGSDKTSREKRLALTHSLDLLNRDKHRLALLFERDKALKDKKTRLLNWTAPDSLKLQPNHEYRFRLKLTDNGAILASAEVLATPHGNWFNYNRFNNLVIALLLAGLILYYTNRARKNPEQIFVRRIAGLEAVDEAIGRATEMGKPIFFVHGLAAISTISTVAAINILGKIAEKVAEYGTEFKVTNRDPVVLAVSQETVKESYLRSGRPDLYNEDNVFYVSQDQFSYATGVEGMFLREKPASNFFFGYYYAEALLLTETGSHIGAIQIAGTDSYTQLPFFITTCDYTLMGEELYAASAYMSREPKLLASLKAQDITKGILIVFMTLGVVLSTFGINWLLHWTKSF